MKVSAIITLKKDVLDPQGKVIHQTLDGMGFKDINEVRQGKYFEINVKEDDPKKAEMLVEEKIMIISICDYEFSDKTIDMYLNGFKKIWSNLDKLKSL